MQTLRAERRLEIASIRGMPPTFWGLGRITFGEASPRAGFGRSCPIMPSASFVRVLIAITSYFWPRAG